MAVQEIDSVEKNVYDRNVTVIDFYGSKCPACLSIHHLLEIVSEQFGSQITFFKLNVDNNIDQARKLDIRAIPTIIFFKCGEEVDRHTGLISKDGLYNRLEKLLADEK